MNGIPPGPLQTNLSLWKSCPPCSGRRKASTGTIPTIAQPGDFDARRKLVTACTDAGFIGENVYLFCASEGLGTVFRAMINANYIQQCLKLPVFKKVLYAQSVGYPSKS